MGEEKVGTTGAKPEERGPWRRAGQALDLQTRARVPALPRAGSVSLSLSLNYPPPQAPCPCLYRERSTRTYAWRGFMRGKRTWCPGRLVQHVAHSERSVNASQLVAAPVVRPCQCLRVAPSPAVWTPRDLLLTTTSRGNSAPCSRGRYQWLRPDLRPACPPLALRGSELSSRRDGGVRGPHGEDPPHRQPPSEQGRAYFPASQGPCHAR